jgi:TIR domain
MAIESYFSHSWSPQHVELNALVWDILHKDCVLFVDFEGDKEGTYYVNRLEELIRKSDVFVSVLPFRQVTARPITESPDYRINCSPFSLFEIRLAERARKPRWIIYDDNTGLNPLPSTSELVVYTPIDADEELGRGGRSIRGEGERWLRRVKNKLTADKMGRSRRAAILTDEHGAEQKPIDDAITRALSEAGYLQVQKIEPSHTDADVIHILQASGLIIAEVGSPTLAEIYGMAHALFVPAIRFLMTDNIGVSLPRLLSGHPGGYQHDLIATTDVAALESEIKKRAIAMRDKRRPIEGLEAGNAYLRQKLYRDHRVFISHNLKPKDAPLIAYIFDKLKNLGVNAWEYRHANRAGEVWKDVLTIALEEATDVVFIFDENFELSPICAEELTFFTKKQLAPNAVMPFLWGNRTKPSPSLQHMHHERLPSDHSAAGDILVSRLCVSLRAI